MPGEIVGDQRVILVGVEEMSGGTAASLNVGTLNAGVSYTADAVGVAGNSIRVAHINPNTANAALSVAVSGNDITVNLANGATAGTITSTAAQVRDAVNAHAGASALVNAGLTGDGTGTAVAQALTNLAGGVDGTITLNYVAMENETSHSRSGENESVEINSKGDLHAKSLVGIASDSLSLEAYAHGDISATQAQNRLATARRNREIVYVEYAARDVATGTITPIEYNYGNVTSIESEAGMDEAVSLSIEIELQDFWSETDYFAAA